MDTSRSPWRTPATATAASPRPCRSSGQETTFLPDPAFKIFATSEEWAGEAIHQKVSPERGRAAFGRPPCFGAYFWVSLLGHSSEMAKVLKTGLGKSILRCLLE